MSDDDNNLDIGINPQLDKDLLRLIRRFGDLNKSIMSLNTDKLITLGIDNKNASAMLAEVRQMVREVKLLDDLMSASSVRRLNQSKQTWDIYNGLMDPKRRQQTMQKTLGSTPAEQRIALKALGQVVSDQLGSGDKASAKMFQEFGAQLKHFMQTQERQQRQAFNLAPQEQRVQRRVGRHKTEQIFRTNDIYDALTSGKKRDRSQMMSRLMQATPAEQKEAQKAIKQAVNEALGLGNAKLSNELQTFSSQLKAHAANKEKLGKMSYDEQQQEKVKRRLELKKAKAAVRMEPAKTARFRQKQMQEEGISSLLRYANKSHNKAESVVRKGALFDQMNAQQRADLLKAQSLHVATLEGATRPNKSRIDTAKAELEKLTSIDKELKEANKRQKMSQTSAQRDIDRREKALKDKDSRIGGIYADRTDNQRYANERHNKLYWKSREDSEGVRDLERKVKYQREFLKLKKAEHNNDLNHWRVKAEQRFLERKEKQLEDLKTRVSSRRSQERAIGNNYNRDLQISRAAMSRQQSHERQWGDSGASLMRTQAGLLGNYALLGGGIGLTGLSIDFVLDLDRSFRQLQSILALNNGELATLSDHLIEVSEKTKFTALEVVDAATTMGQAGFSPEQIKNSIESTTYLATAIGSDIKTAMDLQTSILGIYNKSSSESMDIADKVVTAINKSKLNIEKLTLGMQYSGNISAQLGVSAEENMAALAAMANSGIRSGSTLGTGMRQIYTALQKPSAGFLKWLHSVGIEMSELDVQAHGLYNVLKRLQDAGFSMTTASKVWETRAASAVGAVLNNMSQFREMMLDFDLSMGSAEAANERQMQATRNELERMYSILGTITAEGVEPLRLAFTNVLSVINEVLTSLNKMESFAPTLQALTTLLVSGGTGYLAGKGLGLIKNLIMPSLEDDRIQGRSRRGRGRVVDVQSAANLAIIAQSLKKLLLGTARVALSGTGVGLLVGGGAAIYSVMAAQRERESDLLDQTQTKLAENLVLYQSQQNSIDKVNKALIDMSQKAKLFEKSPEAFARFSNQLEVEFGSLGLVLSDLEGDYDKTRSALEQFRQALIDGSQVTFPRKSFQEVSEAQETNLKAQKGFPKWQVERDIYGSEWMEYPNGAVVRNQSANTVRRQMWKDGIMAGKLPLLKQGLSWILSENPQTAIKLGSLNAQDTDSVFQAYQELNAAKSILMSTQRNGFFPQGTAAQTTAHDLVMMIDNRLEDLTAIRRNIGDQEQFEYNEHLKSFVAEHNTPLLAKLDKLQTSFQLNRVGTMRDPYIDPWQQAQDIYKTNGKYLARARDLADSFNTNIQFQTGFKDSYTRSDFPVFREIEQFIQNLTPDYEEAEKYLWKMKALDAKESHKAYKARYNQQYALINKTDDPKELKRLEQVLHGLLESLSSLEFTQTNVDPETLEGKLRLESERRETEAQKLQVRDTINHRLQALLSADNNAKLRQDNQILWLEGSTEKAAIQRIQYQMGRTHSVPELNKLYEELTQAVKALTEIETEQFNAKVTPNARQTFQIAGLFQTRQSEQLKRYETFYQQQKFNIENGVLKDLQRNISSGLRVEKSELGKFLSDESVVNRLGQSNLQQQVKNLLNQLSLKDTNLGELPEIQMSLDLLVEKLVKAKMEALHLKGLSPKAHEKALTALKESEQLLQEEMTLRIVKARQRILDREQGSSSEGTRLWVKELNADWNIRQTKLRTQKNQQGKVFNEAQTEALAFGEFTNTLQKQLGIEGMASPFYQSVKTALDTVNQQWFDQLIHAYQQNYASMSVDLQHLQHYQTELKSRLGSGHLNIDQTISAKKVLAQVEKEISQLEEERSANLEKQLKLDQELKDKNTQTQEGYNRNTVFNGRYKTPEYRNRQAKIWGGELYNSDGTGTETVLHPDMQGMDNFAKAWEAVKNSASEYARIMKENHGNYDPMIGALDGMVQGTEQLVGKTVDLFAEWAKGTVSSKDAWKALGEFALSTLMQIAQQLIINQTLSVLSDFMPGNATGGKQGKASGGKMLRRNTGGKIPNLNGKVSQGQDTIPTLTMPDEWVIRAPVARRWGDDVMAGINNGDIKPSDFKKPEVTTNLTTGPSELNVWVVSKPEDAGNGGITENDVIAIVEDNVMRRGSLRTLIKSIKLS